MDEAAYPTPEAAVMAEWAAYPGARAFVVSVRFLSDDDAVVLTDTDPSHPMQNFVHREDGGWVYLGDGSD